ncbi:hypothetical protein H4Q26_002031 [Puccinia striiformis f. sp. tritici PST-130]|nr:hypothetical protein H4Q26_002031 [Puccinia striiformis f. sp. tritici PST-130]
MNRFTFSAVVLLAALVSAAPAIDPVTTGNAIKAPIGTTIPITVGTEPDPIKCKECRFLDFCIHHMR